MGNEALDSLARKDQAIEALRMSVSLEQGRAQQWPPSEQECAAGVKTHISSFRPTSRLPQESRTSNENMPYMPGQRADGSSSVCRISTESVIGGYGSRGVDARDLRQQLQGATMA